MSGDRGIDMEIGFEDGAGEVVVVWGEIAALRSQ